MKTCRGSLVLGTFVAVTLSSVAPARARNPACTGGIQYLTQAIRQKERGNLDDHRRMVEKSYRHLTRCVEEDSGDLEALGYLGWVLVEMGKTQDATRVLEDAIGRLQREGQRRKAERFVRILDGLARPGKVGGQPPAPPGTPPWPSGHVGGPTESALDLAVSTLAADVEATVNARERKRVAVVPFSRQRGGVPELGLFLADKMTNRLFNSSAGFAVVDRFHFDEALAEIRLGYSHLQDPASAKRLGKMLGADALVTGTLTQLDRTFDVTVRLVDTETMDVLATAEARLARDPTTERLWNTEVGSPLGKAVTDRQTPPRGDASPSGVSIPARSTTCGGSALPPGYFYLEDFSAYQVGTVPYGWLGTEFTAVRAGPRGKREFTNIESRDDLRIESCKISFPEDFDFSVEFSWDYGNIGFALGGLFVRLRDSGEAQVNQTRRGLGRRLENSPHALTISKRGQLVSVLLDQIEIGTSSAATTQINNVRLVVTNVGMQHPARSLTLRRIVGRVPMDD